MSTQVPVYQEPSFISLIRVKTEPRYCKCTLLEMNPEVAYINGERRHRDTNCGRLIPYSHVVEYDKFYGYNGFDEVVDCE